MSFALLLGLLAPTAWSCDPMPMMAFVVAPDAEDTVAPEAPILQDLSVYRGERERFGSNVSHCGSDTLGTLSFTLEQPGIDAEIDEDGLDLSAPPVGFRVRVVEGELPAELEQRLEGAWHGLAFRAEGDPYVDHIYFQWDDPPRRQEPLAAVVEIVSVDRAGNESAPLRVEVEAPAAPAGACTHAPAPALAPLGLLALVGARRRSRPRAA